MEQRIKKLRKIITSHSLDSVLISSPSHIFYFTGYAGFSKEEREAYLLITSHSLHVFTDGRYTTAMKDHLPSFTIEEISGKNSFITLLKQLIKTQTLKNIGFEDTHITVHEFTKLQSLPVHLSPLSLVSLRVQKDNDEIDMIQKACTLGDKAFIYILSRVRYNITEKELASDLEIFIKQYGADVSFPSIIAFGENAAIPHHHTSNNKLEKNDFVLVDFGVKYNNYCSDMTRTVFFGSATPEQKMMYQAVKDSQEKAYSFLSSIFQKIPLDTKKYISASDVDHTARQYILDQSFPSIPHSVGHGIGIEVHESPHISPHSKDILAENMVFSLEPGIYKEKYGGVRIEDLVVLKKDGPHYLTHSSRELIEL
jgi:Xaa-Pro aminopeptidase